jgi:hypothetical protein
MLAQFVLISPKSLLMLPKPSKKLCVLTSASTTWLLPTRSNPCEKNGAVLRHFFLPEIHRISTIPTAPFSYLTHEVMPVSRHSPIITSQFDSDQ